MWLQLVNVLYVLVSIAMIGLILMQRGAGAQAGSGFGGGASATVFGSRGASNFLTKTTKWLGILFFVIAMGMAVYAKNAATGNVAAAQAADLGVMAQQPAPAAPAQQVPSAQIPAAQTQPQPVAPVAAPQYGQQPATDAAATDAPAATPAATEQAPAPAPAQ